MKKEEYFSKEILKKAKELNVVLNRAYGDGKDRISSIQFNFPGEVYADLANKEGELLPACCANISSIRDAFIGAMREDGDMRAEDIQSLVINMSGHEFDKNHPVTHVKKVYDVFENNLDFRKMNLTADPKEIDHSRIQFGQLFEFCSQWGAASLSSDWGVRGPRCFHERATHNRGIYQVLPAIKALYDHLKEKGFGPVDGYALCRKTCPGEVYEFASREMAIFPTKEEANEVLKLWLNGKQVKAEDVELRKVRVSIENGVEFIEKIEHHWEEEASKVSEQQSQKIWDTINSLRRENEAKYNNDAVEAILLDTLHKIRALKEAPQRR